MQSYFQLPMFSIILVNQPSAMEQKPSLMSGPASWWDPPSAHTFRRMWDAHCVHYEPEFLMLPTVRTTEVSKAK